MFVPPPVCEKCFSHGGQTKEDRLTHWLTQRFIYIDINEWSLVMEIMMILDEIICSPHSVECSYKDSWQQLLKKSDTGRSFWHLLSIRAQVLVMWVNLTIGDTLLDLPISIFDQGNKKKGYLLDICMILAQFQWPSCNEGQLELR